MAPDKIFLHKVRDEENSGFHKIWFESRARLVPSEEYIRKDVLLEWAKKEMGEWSSESNTAQGVKMGLTLVIDKIESL